MRPEQASVAPQFLQHIWVVTGPAGSGKSTVGRYLQQELGVPFIEGDDVSCLILPQYRYCTPTPTMEYTTCIPTYYYPRNTIAFDISDG
jgi:tRNA A37 N6-isopentenylltransferase MiaA